MLARKGLLSEDLVFEDPWVSLDGIPPVQRYMRQVRTRRRLTGLLILTGAGSLRHPWLRMLARCALCMTCFVCCACALHAKLPVARPEQPFIASPGPCLRCS